MRIFMILALLLTGCASRGRGWDGVTPKPVTADEILAYVCCIGLPVLLVISLIGVKIGKAWDDHKKSPGYQAKLAREAADRATRAAEKKEANKVRDAGLAAKKKYEDALAMLKTADLGPAELKAAEAKAKQQYLRDIDEVMK